LKRLVIYAGFHKTGTTAIQGALSACRDALLDAGVTYPKAKSGNAQHYLAKSPSSAARKKATDEIRQFLASSDHVLLASEFFSEFSEKSVESLANSLQNVDIQVVFSMRPLEQMVPSQYQQLVRIGLDKSYVDFVDSLLDHSEKSKDATLFWNRHDQAGIIAKWSKHLGPENVHVILVDPSNPSYLFQWFEKYLDLPAGTLHQHVSENINRSLDADELELIRALRRLMGEERVATEWIKLYRNRFIRTLVSKKSANPLPVKLQMNEKQRVYFQNLGMRYEKDIRELAVQIHDGGWSFGAKGKPPKPATANISSDSVSGKVHIESIAAAMVSIRPEDSLKVIPTRALFRELLRRIRLKLR
jgi:hypothetical protein